MSDYRIYHLRMDDHIDRAEKRHFDDDAQAIQFADRLLENLPGVEVWQHTRLVKRMTRISRARAA